MRIKHRKSSAFHCNAGSRCSVSVILWSFVGCILIIHFISLANQKNEENQVRSSNHHFAQELEEVEEEEFHMPAQRGKRNPRAIKRKGPKKQHSVMDEFLDESSELRPYFFPEQKYAIGPTREMNDSKHFYPGKIWLDTDGNPIQAHGGGVLFDERTETYYWYGENKDGPTYHSHSKGAARVS